MNIQNIPSMTSDEIYEDMCLKIERLEYMPGEKLIGFSGIITRYFCYGIINALHNR